MAAQCPLKGEWFLPPSASMTQILANLLTEQTRVEDSASSLQEAVTSTSCLKLRLDKSSAGVMDLSRGSFGDFGWEDGNIQPLFCDALPASFTFVANPRVLEASMALSLNDRLFQIVLLKTSNWCFLLWWQWWKLTACILGVSEKTRLQ